jgi:thioredoxin 1
MEYKFTKDNFDQEVLSSQEPVMIDFYADWCMPCRMMGPAVKELAEKYAGKVKIGKVNSDLDPELAARYGVMSIPNFVFIKDGHVVDQAMGAMPKMMLEKKIKNLLA